MQETPDFTLDELTGRTRAHLQELSDPACALHKRVVSPFLTLRAAAAADGIDLLAVSCFRDFERQLAIWNRKFNGERPVQDREGRPLDMAKLDAAGKVQAILWWSALPGASRHHWGTDFDVVDAAAMPPGYQPRLVPSEYEEGGPFHRLATWMDTNLHAFGFYRPYTTDRGGVLPEPWHLSHARTAVAAQERFTLPALRSVLESVAIEGKAEVLAALDGNFTKYVANVDTPPEVALLGPALR